MKKDATIIVVLLLIIAIAIYGLNRIKTPPVEPAEEVQATSTVATTTTDLTVQVKSISTSTPSLKMNVEYPQFSDVAYAKLNADIKRDAQNLYDQGLRELQADNTSASIINVDMGDEGLVIERKLDKEKTYINSETGIASFSFNNYANTGGAHPTFFYTSSTYDLKNGNALALRDLFKGEYEPFLSTYLKDRIVKAKEGDTDCVRCDTLGGQVETENAILVDVFSLNEKGIVFLYGAYDLGSYAATSAGQEVFVPKDKLGEFVQKGW